MCGIAGIWDVGCSDDNSILIKKMTDSIQHRGPDGEGVWQSENKTVALGHRRLAIIDLTEGGHQPMHFRDRFVITFNGEIYNYLELRSVLIRLGYEFLNNSDTEILLAAFNEWGIAMLAKLDGMFAFAIYDRREKKLFCARDRFGEKPFYYTYYNNKFYFASEMKALWAAGVSRKLKMTMLYNYLVNDLVENPDDQRETFYDNIFKLKAAHYFSYSGGAIVEQEKYWTLSTTSVINDSFEEAGEKIRELLETSVKRRLRSDVPVGSSLSGGLDSSSIVGLVSKFSEHNHTFSARFRSFTKDEGSYIDLVCKRYKTEHHDIYINENQLFEELEKLLFHQEEPIPTGSMYAQFKVYEEARRCGILVMLDGQGADEIFGGYDKDFQFYVRELKKNNGDVKAFLHQLNQHNLFDMPSGLKHSLRMTSPRLFSLLAVIQKKIHNPRPEGITREFYDLNRPKSSPFKDFDDLKSMLHHELTNQGLEKLLKFADRNSMANSVEVRLPFLYHELVEYAFSLRSSYFLKDGWSKALLRLNTTDLVPQEIRERKLKIGFEAPHNEWLKQVKFKPLLTEAKSNLIANGIIEPSYTNDWKVLIANNFIKS